MERMMNRTTSTLVGLGLLFAAVAVSQMARPSEQKKAAAASATMPEKNKAKARKIMQSMGEQTGVIIELKIDDKKSIILEPKGAFSLETALQAIGQELMGQNHAVGEKVSAEIGGNNGLSENVVQTVCFRSIDSVTCEGTKRVHRYVL
jgi:23S rRNA pseudoU1915 N3-methylase RlmH